MISDLALGKFSIMFEAGMISNNAAAATQSQAKRLRQSFGIWTAMLRFLSPREQQLMQLGDQFCYNSAVGRVVTFCTVNRAPILYIDNLKQISAYYIREQKSEMVCNTGGQVLSFIQSRNNIFIYANQTIDGNNQTNWLIKDSLDSQFSDSITVGASPIFSLRKDASLTNFKDKFVYLSGGIFSGGRIALIEVFQYDIEKDSWTVAPSLNERRAEHGSCVIENSIYICGGYKRRIDAKGEPIKGIEKLKLSREIGVVQGSSQWETLNVGFPKLARFRIVPISSEEILFIGESRYSRTIGVSLLSLVDLKWTDPTKIGAAVGYAPEMQPFK